MQSNHHADMQAARDVRRWHIVGDSHVTAFQAAAAAGLIDRPCRFSIVGGATAVGLRNPNSLTDAVGLFKRALLPPAVGTTPVIHLGEVDCGFVIWYRARKYGESVEWQRDRSVAATVAFAEALLAAGYRSVVISGASVPTIRDGQEWGQIANARREVTATLHERTALTLTYNAALRATAIRLALPFIDIAGDVVDAATQVVADTFRHPDPTDHHLDPDKVGALWARELNRIA